MHTLKYYQQDVYCRELSATITDILQEDRRIAIVFNRTIFFPTGGGQPCDIGTIISSNGTRCSIEETVEATVSDETAERSEILHYLAKDEGTTSPSMANNAAPLTVGETVTLYLDWNNRYANMQAHCGEHILTGAFTQLYGGANKGFHIGKDYITIDMDYDGRRLTDEEVLAAERLANEIIWQNLEITVSTFPNREAASVMPTRKPVTQDGVITIITIGPSDNPYDCVACCGTHFRSTGEVGLIRILKVEPNKGMNRIFFCCGSHALNDMQEEHALLRTVEDRFSVGGRDLLHKLDVQSEKETGLRQHLSALTRCCADREKDRIHSELHDTTPSFYHTAYELLPADDLIRLGFAVMADESAPTLLAFTHRPDHTVLLFSNGNPACGDLVKANAAPLGGRGGGRPDQARALFPSADAAAKFIEALQESLLSE